MLEFDVKYHKKVSRKSWYRLLLTKHIIVSRNYFKDGARIWCGGLENVSLELPLIGA